MKAVVKAAGMNRAPDCVAVHPNMDCVYTGMIKVEPYNPNPKINENMVPILKLVLFKTLRSTIGFLVVNSLHIKKKTPNTVKINRVVIVLLANQSSSCPRSKIYCKEPTETLSKAMPIQSISLADFFSLYLGLLTYCRS